MSVICVPGKTSPYQNVDGPTGQPASLKASVRHAVVSGDDASARPLRYRQSVPLATRSKARPGSADNDDQSSTNENKRKRVMAEMSASYGPTP